MATPSSPVPPLQQPAPRGGVIALSMTLIAVVPLCSVLGMVIALKTGGDTTLSVLVGAALGTVYSLWKGRG